MDIVMISVVGGVVVDHSLSLKVVTQAQPRYALERNRNWRVQTFKYLLFFDC